MFALYNFARFVTQVGSLPCIITIIITAIFFCRHDIDNDGDSQDEARRLSYAECFSMVTSQLVDSREALKHSSHS